MFIKNMTKRERAIAIATVSLVAGAVLYNFMIDPIARTWQSLNGEIEAKASALKNDIGIIASRKTIEADYAKFSGYAISGKTEEETTAETLSYLEDLSRGDSCAVSNIKPVGAKDFGAYKELLIELSSEGTMGQLAKFLFDIENAKGMILKVRHFVLTSRTGQDGALRGTFLVSKIIIE